MHPENPAVEACRRDTIIVPTAETVRGMDDALQRMARLALKLGTGEGLGPADAEGYLPKGIRVNELAKEVASERAVELVLRKLRGDTETEWPLPRYERVRPAAAADGGKRLRVALVSEGAVVPKGNPDKLPSGWCKAWLKYDVKGVDGLSNEEFETVHGGFDTTNGNQDPDRLIPLDALRELERAGRVEVWRDLYVTNGNMGSLTDMTRIGSEIAHELRQEGVDVAIIGAT
jgi:glycine reductase